MVKKELCSVERCKAEAEILRNKLLALLEDTGVDSEDVRYIMAARFIVSS